MSGGLLATASALHNPNYDKTKPDGQLQRPNGGSKQPAVGRLEKSNVDYGVADMMGLRCG